MTHLFDRLLDAKERLAPVQSKYRVVFEDPACPDACASVLIPDPNWLACALAGGILPPVETYIRDREIEEAFNAKHEHLPPPLRPVFRWADHGGASHPYADPIPAMTEEEAIEYLIQKDIPPRVWRDYRGNRCILRIVPVELVPSDRSFRGAWRVAQDIEEEMAA
ncbi:hypothetical protein [Microcystis phage Mel-JY33]